MATVRRRGVPEESLSIGSKVGGVQSMRLIDGWPVDNASAAVVTASGHVVARRGELSRVFRLASVTKLITAYAALIAVEEGVAQLDDPAGPPGATIRHLLAHASGLAFADRTVVAKPGTRRIYSNAGFEELADTLAKRSGIPFADYVRAGVLAPLGMTATTFDGSPAAGASSSVSDLAQFAAELQRPTLVDASTMAEASRVAFPRLIGVLPGFGRQEPNDWGLGFEIRDGKSPHWTGSTSSPATFGHFGQAGTFLWVDPRAEAACIVLTDRHFGSWAAGAWPTFTDAVLSDLRGGDAVLRGERN
jgi:CubicO group peptidase (beta-lactamase class C family)